MEQAGVCHAAHRFTLLASKPWNTVGGFGLLVGVGPVGPLRETARCPELPPDRSCPRIGVAPGSELPPDPWIQSTGAACADSRPDERGDWTFFRLGRALSAPADPLLAPLSLQFSSRPEASPGSWRCG